MSDGAELGVVSFARLVELLLDEAQDAINVRAIQTGQQRLHNMAREAAKLCAVARDMQAIYGKPVAGPVNGGPWALGLEGALREVRRRLLSRDRRLRGSRYLIAYIDHFLSEKPPPAPAASEKEGT